MFSFESFSGFDSNIKEIKVKKLLPTIESLNQAYSTYEKQAVFNYINCYNAKQHCLRLTFANILLKISFRKIPHLLKAKSSCIQCVSTT